MGEETTGRIGRHTGQQETIRSIVRIVLFLAVAAALLIGLTPRDTLFDGPLHLAERILQGHLYFEEPHPSWEMFTRDGRYFLVYAPMTSIVLVPYVLLGGSHFGMPVANTLFLLGATVLLWHLFRRVRPLRPWADIAATVYLLGTSLLYSVAVGTVWLLIHSEGNLFLFAALIALQKRRWYWFGLFFAMAVTCRNALLFGLPLLLPVLWGGFSLNLSRPRLRRILRRLSLFTLGALPPVLVAFVLNWGMTGDPWVSTYSVTYAQWGLGDHLYSKQYFWSNLHAYFTYAPKIIPNPPFLRFEPGGQSFWIVSPFFLFLLPLRRGRTRLLRVCQIGAVCAFLPYLFFKWNGYAQYGSRYTTDIFPFLMPLAFYGASAWRRHPGIVRIVMLLCAAAAIAVNLLAAILWHTGKIGF